MFKTERRNSPRFEVCVYVVCRKTCDISNPIEGITRNIGLDGLCMETDKPVKLGEDLKLEIHIPSNSKNVFIYAICAKGVAVWVKKLSPKSAQGLGSNKFSVGVKFKMIKKKDKDVLIKFCMKDKG